MSSNLNLVSLVVKQKQVEAEIEEEEFEFISKNEIVEIFNQTRSPPQDNIRSLVDQDIVCINDPTNLPEEFPLSRASLGALFSTLSPEEQNRFGNFLIKQPEFKEACSFSFSDLVQFALVSSLWTPGTAIGYALLKLSYRVDQTFWKQFSVDARKISSDLLYPYAQILSLDGALPLHLRAAAQNKEILLKRPPFLPELTIDRIIDQIADISENKGLCELYRDLEESIETLTIDGEIPLDLKAVQKNYRELQRKYHPDKNRNSDTSKKSQELNTAHENFTSAWKKGIRPVLDPQTNKLIWPRFYSEKEIKEAFEMFQKLWDLGLRPLVDPESGEIVQAPKRF